MNCRNALEYRDDYIDGYLSQKEKVAVREHNVQVVEELESGSTI